MSPEQELVSRHLADHGEQAQSAQDDLRRLQVLLAEAGDSLMASFDALQISFRQTLAAAQNAARPAVPQAPCSLDRVAEQFQRQTQDAVRALQFQDIASQLVGHVAERIELMRRLSQDLAELPGATPERLREILAGGGAVRRNPVHQECLSSGTVELF